MTLDPVTFMVVLLAECEQSHNSSRRTRSVTGPRTLPITYGKRANTEPSVLESKVETQIFACYRQRYVERGSFYVGNKSNSFNENIAFLHTALIVLN